MRSLVATLALASVFTASAQAASLPGFVLAAETEHVSFFTRGQDVDSARVERRVEELADLLGQPLGQRVSYYRYDTAQELAAGTGHYAAGVTFPGTAEVHSTEAFHDHELVHVVAGQLGDPGTFFQEGLAVAIGNGGRWQGRPVDRVAQAHSHADVEGMMAAFDRFDAAVAYPVAGSFVKHLIRTHGLPRVASFFRACPPGTDIGRAFARTFGHSLAEAAAAWRGSL
jgi:hypothetical protein